jgi:hypothetical protein
MYGNNFDYTGQQPDVDREYLKQIMEDTRNEVSQYTAQGYPDEDMGARFEAAGVGNVGDFLEEAYVPYIPTDTPSYAEFMSATPQNIANVIGATQAQYQAGRAERTKDFQNILNDVKKFTYGDDDAFNNIAPGSSPKTVNLADLNGLNSAGAADAELKALKLKTIGAAGDDPLGYLTGTFGPSFGLNDYNKLIDGGQNQNSVEKRINQYAKAGGSFTNKVQDMPFFNDKPNIGSFMQGDSFGQADKQRAKEAGYTNKEIRQWKKEKGYF